MALHDIVMKRSGTAGDCLGGAIFDAIVGQQTAGGSLPSGLTVLRAYGNPQSTRALDFQPETLTGEPKVVRVNIVDMSAASLSVRLDAQMTYGAHTTPLTYLTGAATKALQAAEAVSSGLKNSADFIPYVSVGDAVVVTQTEPVPSFGTVGDESYVDVTGKDNTDFSLSVLIFDDSSNKFYITVTTLVEATGPHLNRIRFDGGAWVDITGDGIYTLHSGTDDGFIVIQVNNAGLPVTKDNGIISITTPEADLFSNISGYQGLTGIDEYLCVYLCNDDSVSHDFKFYIPDPPQNATLSIGLGSSGVGGTEQIIPDINTAPTGVTFAAPADAVSSTITATIPAGSHCPVWLYRALVMGNYGTVTDDLSQVSVNIL